jgi:ABC-2 type transport system permease protein
MKQIPIFLGVLKYEFKMQIRRRSLWFAFACFAFLIIRTVLNGFNNPERLPINMPLVRMVAYLTIITNWLAPLGVGIFLADRLPRDRRTKVEELLNTLPGTLSTRLAGKYLGSTLAVLVPAFAMYCIVVGTIIYYTHNVLAIPIALLTYLTIVIPGILFIASFSLACTSIMWVPLYQFLFVGYWFWGNLFSPEIGIPTLSPTILTPIGGFISAGFFGASSMPWTNDASLLQGIASLLLLLAIAALVMVILHTYLRWQQARQ